jgi:tRNA(fMet)-specific endonuclease VapC
VDYVVLDTNIVSFYLKNDSRRTFYNQHLANRVWCVSFQTVAELYYWAVEKNWGPRRRQEMQGWLSHCVSLPADIDTINAWVDIRDQSRHLGRTMETTDIWVAASALSRNHPLITHNPKHFRHISGLTMITEAP